MCVDLSKRKGFYYGHHTSLLGSVLENRFSKDSELCPPDLQSKNRLRDEAYALHIIEFYFRTGLTFQDNKLLGARGRCNVYSDIAKVRPCFFLFFFFPASLWWLRTATTESRGHSAGQSSTKHNSNASRCNCEHVVKYFSERPGCFFLSAVSCA